MRREMTQKFVTTTTKPTVSWLNIPSKGQDSHMVLIPYRPMLPQGEKLRQKNKKFVTHCHKTHNKFPQYPFQRTGFSQGSFTLWLSQGEKLRQNLWHTTTKPTVSWLNIPSKGQNSHMVLLPYRPMLPQGDKLRQNLWHTTVVAE